MTRTAVTDVGSMFVRRESVTPAAMLTTRVPGRNAFEMSSRMDGTRSGGIAKTTSSETSAVRRFAPGLLDEEVLRTLYKASGNPVLVEVIDTLWLRCRPFKAIGVTKAIVEHDNTPWKPQPALFDAVKAGDTEVATAITADSLASARRRLELRLAAH